MSSFLPLEDIAFCHVSQVWHYTLDKIITYHLSAYQHWNSQWSNFWTQSTLTFASNIQVNKLLTNAVKLLGGVNAIKVNMVMEYCFSTWELNLTRSETRHKPLACAFLLQRTQARFDFGDENTMAPLNINSDPFNIVNKIKKRRNLSLDVKKHHATLA